MADYTKYTNKEMQAITLAQQITNDNIAIVGTGLPLIGASVAKRLFAPKCNLIVESGLMDCSPIEVPRSVGDLRFMAHCGCQWPNIRFIGFEANEWLHDTDRLIAFIGGAQIDPYGNVNSTCIGDYHAPKTRFTGSGGANAIATFSNTIIMIQHEKRRFMQKIDYVTSRDGLTDLADARDSAFRATVDLRQLLPTAVSSNLTRRQRECTLQATMRHLHRKTLSRIQDSISTFPEQ